ncbi:unnamed protein product [Meloidogyne enterolobii]|uniref:Uncharacterized protein n=1 Tax=Meloidogyne enterolobii TaxID=390850 RepID=A0ACB0Z658_MELEN
MGGGLFCPPAFENVLFWPVRSCVPSTACYFVPLSSSVCLRPFKTPVPTRDRSASGSSLDFSWNQIKNPAQVTNLNPGGGRANPY